MEEDQRQYIDRLLLGVMTSSDVYIRYVILAIRDTPWSLVGFASLQ